MKKSDEERLLDYLKENKRITRAECYEKLGFFNLPGRIYDLKTRGHLIETDFEKNDRTRWAVYTYVPPVVAT